MEINQITKNHTESYKIVHNNFIKDLNKRILDLNKEYKSNVKSANSLLLANNILNGLTVGAGATSITTALTVVGLPAAIVTGAISSVSGITSIVLSSVVKSKNKKITKSKKHYAKCLQAKQDIERMIGKTEYILTNEDIKIISDIYYKAINHVEEIETVVKDEEIQPFLD